MDRKLSSIEQKVHDSADDFDYYLRDRLPPKVVKFVERLQKRTKVYLFSGLIRDFFLHRDYQLRDVDFIVNDELDIEKLFPKLEVSRNSFGGYKTSIDSLKVDLWGLDSTWGLNRGQLKFQFGKLYCLPETTFFNFSSILFSMEEREFIIGKPFLRFLRDKTIDIVMEDNPYPSLCIVNSFFYAEKYKLKLSKKLKTYIVKNYRPYADSLRETQLLHFNTILYSQAELAKKYDELKS